jgi:hypothetical protein
VIGELFHHRQRFDVFHAVRLAGVGDDDEMVRADELLVQLRVRDVVRMARKEQRGARRHVADL